MNTVININTDKPCSLCGKKGVVNKTGICIECAGKKIVDKLQWKIGDKTVAACIDILQSLLWQYHAEINRAYTLNPGELVINLTLKIGMTDKGNNEIKGGISFTIEKLKADVDKVYIDESQESLFKK